jgi:hypothetical protein
MARKNRAGFSESVTIARDTAYPYRSGMGMFSSAEWVTFFDDFQRDVATNVPVGWDAAIIDTGATIASFATSAAANANGVIRITSDAASEGAGIYLPKQVYLSGKRFFMEVRVRTAAATDTTLYFGLSDLSATTDPEDLWDTSNADGIAFGVSDGDATPQLVYDKDNGGPVTNAASGTTFDLANSTWVTLAIWYNGASVDASKSLKGYVNGSEAVSAATVAQVPEDVLLAPFIGALGGNGAIGTIDVDYVRFALER